MANSVKHVVLTGPPGIGKTTLIQKACEQLRSLGVTPGGFYTEEKRASGKRTGFDVVTLSGRRGTLARVKLETGIPGGRECRVGQYTVDVTSFEQTVLTELEIKKDSPPSVVVIDEVGKMELFSQAFVQTVKKLFSNPQTVILATIPISKGKPIPLVEEIRTRPDAKLFIISRENRNSILDDIVHTVKNALESIK